VKRSGEKNREGESISSREVRNGGTHHSGKAEARRGRGETSPCSASEVQEGRKGINIIEKARMQAYTRKEGNSINTWEGETSTQ